MFGNLFQYKSTTRRLVPIFYGNLRRAGAQTVWLLRFMLICYTTKNLSSKNNHRIKNTTMVELVAGLATGLRCFEPPHPRETLWEGLFEGFV